MFEKVTELVVKALVAVRKQKISKSKTTALTYFDNLKKKQQDQGGKNWYYIQSLNKTSSRKIRLLST